jgi:protein-S-isoprenylcysteine O-methyltransferase Ste14
VHLFGAKFDWADMMKWIDIPPVWLIAAVIVAWVQGTLFPIGFSFGGYWADFVGGLFVGGGILLMLLAVYEMRKHKTTVIPHREADTMVTTGIFSRSRNPIYLGDVLLLAGLVLRFDAVLSLPLVPVLLWVLEKRFVIPEENRLRVKFRANFARYCETTRRWI